MQTKELKIIHWGVAGPGHAGGRFAEGLRTVEGVTLDAIWGRTRERTRFSRCDLAYATSRIRWTSL